jgi:DNA-binding LacI/PurR family transcriptional regulator
MVQADPWDRYAAPMMLDAAPNATAILSMSVMQAIAVINEGRRRGLSVPGDLSAVGYLESIPKDSVSGLRDLARLGKRDEKVLRGKPR